MNKTIWTPELIGMLQFANKLYKGNRKEIAAIMDMTYNQINGALRRFCRGKNADWALKRFCKENNKGGNEHGQRQSRNGSSSNMRILWGGISARHASMGE